MYTLVTIALMIEEEGIFPCFPETEALSVTMSCKLVFKISKSLVFRLRTACLHVFCLIIAVKHFKYCLELIVHT